MLQASKEQQEHITEIINNSFGQGIEVPSGYANDTDITLWIPYDGGYDSVCVDISFDMMAEIVDYLREQNNK
jgi:hypothetical protein